MKGVLITAAVFCVVGLVLTAIGLARLNFDFTRLTNDPPKEGGYTATQPVSRLEITVDTGNVTLLPATDGSCAVEYTDTAKRPVTVTQEEGVLSVRQEDNRRWYDYIQFFSPSTAVTVYLPEEAYESLTVCTSTGDVTVSADLSFVCAEVRTSTGDIRWSAPVTEGLSLTAGTGTVTVEGVSAGQMTLSTSTGHIRVTEGTVAGDVSARTSTGDIRLTDLRATGTLTAEADTGDIILTRADAATLKLTTDTGNVTGSLLSEKIVFAESDTGRIDVPRSTSGGACTITTDTGNITITIE